MQNTFCFIPTKTPICTFPARLVSHDLRPCENMTSLVQISVIGYLAPCFIGDAEKIAAQLKYKVALIMLSNEIHFYCFNLIFSPLLTIPLICANMAVVSSTIITESCSHFHFNFTTSHNKKSQGSSLSGVYSSS